VIATPSASPSTAGNASLADGFGDHWRPRLETLLADGRAAGADLVEVFLERTDHLGVLAEQERITSVTPAFGMGAGIRVFLAHRDGFVSTNDLSEAGLQRALEQALGMLGLQRNSQAASLFDGLTLRRSDAAARFRCHQSRLAATLPDAAGGHRSAA